MNVLIDEPFNLAGECNKQGNVTIGLYKDTVNGNALYHASMKIIADYRVQWWFIDLFTVYDAILAGGQTRLKLQ